MSAEPRSFGERMIELRGQGADVQAALLYALPFSALLFTGPGAHSIDARLKGLYEQQLRRFLKAGQS